MQKLFVILLMGLLGLSNISQPSGSLQPFNLHEMYHSCSIEDPDITPLDFVFEHLLNLEDVMAYFEGDYDTEEGEQPHKPFQQLQTSVQFTTAILKTTTIKLPFNIVLSDKIDYPHSKKSFYSSNFIADIFHPPIV